VEEEAVNDQERDRDDEAARIFARHKKLGD
jgi:hypothetical protein